MDAATAVNVLSTALLGLVLYVLHGLRASLHELRNQIQIFTNKQATLEAEMRIVKHRLRLADE